MKEPAVTFEVARTHGLSRDEYDRIVERIGRVPSWVELGMISVMWSEHCSYKSSRIHLRKLPTKAPWVLEGPGENAGVIDLGGGVAAAFKMESHNHPSFIEPYQGAGTGVGGILRDVFTMGARPIANLNSLRFGRLENPRMRFLVSGVVAGIGGYGNCIGVPTVGGEVGFDPSYDSNILVNAFTLGVLRSDRIFRSAAAGVGNAVIYVGSKTGRDGIHGATMASEEFGKESEEKRPRVQVGDPFTEKMLLEACLELMREDVVVAIQDMGAAGLTSSSTEMAAKGEVGIEIDVAKVPRRETGMTPYEIMLSESQERMLMVVKSGKEGVAERIFKKWDLDVAVIGRITDTKRHVVKEGDKVVSDLPISIFGDEAPLYDRPSKAPADLEARWSMPAVAKGEAGVRLRALLGRPTIASKRWIYEQYDSSVRDGTVRGPGAADAAVVRLPDADLEPSSSEKRGLAMTVDMDSRFVGLDPRRGAILGVLEAARNLVCVGARPMAVTDCLNFGNPEKPEVMWTLVESIHGLAEACSGLETPIVSGNVSLYNETERRPILPTPTVGMVGLVEDVEKTASIGFKRTGDRVVLLGALDGMSLAGSELLSMETGELRGRPEEPSLDRAKRVHATCLEVVKRGLAQSAHDASEGGFAVALAECCTSARPLVGARVKLAGLGDDVARMFGEGPSVILLSVKPENVREVLAIAEEHGAPCEDVGEVGGERLIVDGVLSEAVRDLEDAWAHGLTRALGIEDREHLEHRVE
jgi:phosphoribosylformylglycinamidine synthase subunit PurL